MRQHVPILGWCFIVYHAIAAFVGICIGAIVTGAGAISGEREVMFLTGTIGIAIAAFLIVVSIPGIIAGIGLLKYRPWARILAIVVGVLHILSFPFGTALGVYTLVVLLHAEAPATFGQQPSTVM
jgi:ABC-type polysaccharide/polyol phosphate export permease